MKKITYLLLLLFACMSYGQTCQKIFEVEGDDDTPMVLTVNASDLDCAVGTINSITITDAILDDYWAYYFGETYCNEYYSFELNIDGVISSVCAEDLIGLEITDFTTLTITSADIDDDADTVYMGVLIEINFTATEVPECTTITGPVTDSENAFNGVLSWGAVSGAVGYRISVGTTTGGTDILDSYEAGNVITYNLPGLLTGGVEYFVNVTPHNAIGDATECAEYSFTSPIPPTGSTCQDPLVVESLPFNATGNTSAYFDTIYEGTPGANNCGTTSGYLGGNDVVYAYTAISDGTITIKMTPTATWSGIFVYDSCENIGVNCVAGAANSGTAVREISEFQVTNGETYYIVISTYADPQTTAYTLDITEDTCTSGAATYTVISDCSTGPQFLVEVNVTDLGSADTMTITDNQASLPQVVDAVGTFTFGPYPNATSVIITVANTQDESCSLTSSALTQAVCPPNCDQAVVIAGCGEQVVATFIAGSGAWNGTNACGYTTPGVEVMYSFTPIETGAYELTVVSATGGYVDYLYKEASGACDTTGWTCIDDLNGANTVNIGTLTAGVEYLFLVDSEGTTARTQTFKIDCLPTCTNPTVAYSIVSNCENGEEFSINIDITDLGTATSLTISDDQDSAVQNSTDLGVLTFGPYPNATEVVITVANDQDETCFLTSSTLTQLACPPANDECVNAVELTVGAVFADNEIVGTNLGATRNPNDHDPTTVTTTCDTYNFNTNGKDVWFKAIVPASGTLTIETAFNDDENFEDTSLYVYTGSCEDLVYVKCSGDISLLDNFFSRTVLTGLIPGEEVTARVFGYNGSAGSFKISAYDASLSNAKFDDNSFKVYPNPVKDILNLSYNQSITNIEIFNMLGQQVLVKAVNATQDQVDMSNLVTGTYLVKVATENQVKTIKVIKE